MMAMRANNWIVGRLDARSSVLNVDFQLGLLRLNNIKKMLLLIFTVLTSVFLIVYPCCGKVVASDNAADTLFPQQNIAAPGKIDAGKSNDKISPTADSIKLTVKRLDIIESRLGPANRQPTPATTIERRLADIEQRLDRLELQFNRIQQMEQRIRKIEAQRY